MIPFDMLHLNHGEENAENGDCMRACIASLFEIPPEKVPHFCEKPDAGRWWTKRVNEWAFFLGYIFIEVDFEDVHKAHFASANGSLFMAGGKSPRGDYGHWVIGRANVNEEEHSFSLDMVHDPHPSRDGITELETLGFFVKIHNKIINNSKRKFMALREYVELEFLKDMTDECINALLNVQHKQIVDLEVQLAQSKHKMLDEIHTRDCEIEDLIERVDKFQEWQSIENPPEEDMNVWIFHKRTDHGDWISEDYVALGWYHKSGNEFFDESHGGSPMAMWKPAHIPKPPIETSTDNGRPIDDRS